MLRISFVFPSSHIWTVTLNRQHRKFPLSYPFPPWSSTPLPHKHSLESKIF